MSATPCAFRSASIDCEMASATPGTVKAARPALGSVGGSASTLASRAARASAISFVCRLAQIPDALMQLRPLLMNTLSTITSR